MTSNRDLKSDPETTSSGQLFSRVLVGVDGSEAGFEACCQAVRLGDPQAVIEAVAVVHLAEAMHAGMDAPQIADQFQRDAELALEHAAQLIGDRVRPRFVNGFVTASLLREIERAEATLVVVGSHGHRRMTEILIGGVAGELLHIAPCAVLVARPAADPEGFPRSIVIGLDGSAAAEYALDAAERLASRLRVQLRVITAVEGKSVDLERVRQCQPPAEEIDARPVEALVAASDAADLLVVGSRGLHGVKALGSVSERVAHQAACSVLVARPRNAG
jgi:nucleotide-binding universal stress UspA family protein